MFTEVLLTKITPLKEKVEVIEGGDAMEEWNPSHRSGTNKKAVSSTKDCVSCIVFRNFHYNCCIKQNADVVFSIQLQYLNVSTLTCYGLYFPNSHAGWQDILVICSVCVLYPDLRSWLLKSYLRFTLGRNSILLSNL